MANCPKCGSLLKYELRSAGTTTKTKYYRTGVKKSWITPAGLKNTKSQRKTYVDSYCPKCGYHPPVKTQKSGFKYIWIIIGLIILLGFIGNVMNGNKTSNNTASQATATPVPQQAAASTETPAEATEAPTEEATASPSPEQTFTPEPTATPIPDTVWALEPTSIDYFDYYLDHDHIYLTGVKNSSLPKKVWIADTYIIDGKTYKIGNRLDDLFALHSITSAIIPEGVEYIEENIFNSCSVKYVYLPKSLAFNEYKPSAFLSYFFELEKLYYGGSEEDWNAGSPAGYGSDCRPQRRRGK